MLGFVAAMLISNTKPSEDMASTIQGIDAAFNIVVLTGATIYFLVSLEETPQAPKSPASAQ